MTRALQKHVARRDAEFIEKLQYLLAYETHIFGRPPDGCHDFGSIAIAVDRHFNPELQPCSDRRAWQGLGQRMTALARIRALRYRTLKPPALCWVLRRLRAGSGVFEEKGGDDEFGEPERHHPFPKGNFHAKILS